jgi:uncharacterized protein YciI
VRTEHRDYLRGLADEGLLLVSGPFGPDEPAGALLLFRTDDKTRVDELVDQDPFTTSGVNAEITTAEWEPIIGPLLPALPPARRTGMTRTTAQLRLRELRARRRELRPR